VEAMKAGRLQAVVIDDFPAQALARKNPEVMVLEEPLSVEEYAIAVKKGSEDLLNQINATLAELKESGKLQEIFDKYIAE
jgi:ABC-type amino acid transport substrate-binding protein